MKNLGRKFITKIKNNKLVIIMFTIICALGCLSYNQYHKILSMKETIFSKNAEIFTVSQDRDTLSYLNRLYQQDIDDYKLMEKDYDNIKSELDKLKQELIISKNTYNSVSRGDFEYMDLNEYRPVTVSELNEWIDKRAPENSPFRGKAADFIMAARLKNKDVKYFIAHCAVESQWGTSQISEGKGNYIGATAYNNDPYNSATVLYGNSFVETLENNAQWLDDNFFSKGRSSLYAMQNEGKPYAQLNDGSKNPDWTPTILDIIYHNNSIN